MKKLALLIALMFTLAATGFGEFVLDAFHSTPGSSALALVDANAKTPVGDVICGGPCDGGGCYAGTYMFIGSVVYYCNGWPLDSWGGVWVCADWIYGNRC